MVKIYNPEYVGRAIKTVLERLKNFEKESESEPLPHTCMHCKYRHMEEGYDQEWGRFFIVRNYCDKDKNLMNTFYSSGNGEHFTKPCDYFKQGKGTYEKCEMNKS